MDARLFKRIALALVVATVGCSKKDAPAIDAQEKNALLSAVSVLQKKGYCLPNPILDEEDIVPLIDGGYKLSPEDQYCVPEADGSFNAGDYNCVPKIFVDSFDATYLINNSYHDDGAEYCNNVIVPDPGTTTGGSTSAGGTDGGAVTGGSTSAGSTDGGSVNSGSTSGGDTIGGSVTGGTTTAGSTDGGSVSGGSTSAGSTDGGSVTGGSTSAGGTDGGSDNGGGTNGSTNSSTSGGDTIGGSVTGGSVTGGTTTAGSTDGGSVTGGSNNGGDTSGGNTNGGSTSGGSTNGSTSGSTTGGSTTGGTANGGCTNGDNSGDGDITWSQPIDRMCSKLRTGNDKYSLNDREQLIVQILKRVKQKNGKYVTTLVCETRDTAQIKKDLIENKKVRIPACDISGYKKSELFISIYSPVVAKDLPINFGDFSNVRFFMKDSTTTGRDELSFVVYGSRSNRYAPLTEKLIVVVDNNPDGTSKDPKWCDTKASPLIVHVNPDQDVAEYVQLSSQDKGVKFDILGLNAEPQAHMVKKISWTNSKQYMFLVKPNAQGRVNGVDEMFGDNTYGPDKDFAPNGFAALAKYDDNKDGVIDSDDAVFFKLRLWIDKNRDGIGAASEMITLTKAKVKVIDLNYDSSFREQDKYGNETVYKSVIKYNNGSLDLIFDVWFNYKD